MTHLYSAMVGAFPQALHPEITSFIGDPLLEEIHEMPAGTFAVHIKNELICIPKKVYVGENINLNLYGQVQRKILCCFFTRHHNGFMREMFLEKIILLNEPWVVPYVISLVGEYVLEILYVIYNNLSKLDLHLYRVFVSQNLPFWELTKQRVISYWHCYFKYTHKIGFTDVACVKSEHIGFKIVNYIEGKVPLP